jgi:hypothetical protein
MDIKRKRIRNDRNIDDSYPGLENALGSSSCDANMNWYARSSSWQGNSNVKYDDIEAEKRENDLRFGVPHDDVLPNPNVGPGYQAASTNGDDTLPNPHNFSSNPGFMGTSTASMMQMAAPREGTGTGSGSRRPSRPVGGGGGPTVGRRPFEKGSVAMPAPGDTDPTSEGTPQGRTSGFGG